MSLNAPLFSVIPEDTARVAKAAFPKGNRYLQLRDTFGQLFVITDFRHLFSMEGRSGEDPARLAVITILQFAERLSDEQAANAVRSRIDWKYLLALPLEDPGFDPSVLSEFRTRLIQGSAEHLLFETLLTTCREYGLLRARGRQRSDSTCAASRGPSIPTTGRKNSKGGSWVNQVTYVRKNTGTIASW
jgi:transposase